ncbi:carboxymuconolactone decarboxylase family protein [Stenotrophomonas indicatrix]
MNIKYSRFSVTELDAHQQAIIPISAFAAAGNMSALDQALNQGLDAGLSVAEVREILVQVYAYAGFPRSLNALSELMRVAQARRQRGIQDEAGREPGRPIRSARRRHGQSDQAGWRPGLRAFVRFRTPGK